MLATYRSFLQGEKVKPWIEGNETDKYVSSMLDDMLVAVDEESIVGAVSIASNTIDLVWVATAKRGHGVRDGSVESGRCDLLARRGILVEQPAGCLPAP